MKKFFYGILMTLIIICLSGCGGSSTGVVPGNVNTEPATIGTGSVEFLVNAPDIAESTKDISGQVISPFVQTIDIYLYNDPNSFDPANPTNYTGSPSNQWRHLERTAPGANTWANSGPFNDLPYGKKVAFFIAKTSAGMEMARRTCYFELTPANSPLRNTVNLGVDISPDGTVNPKDIIINLNDSVYWVNTGSVSRTLNFTTAGTYLSPNDPNVVIPSLGMASRQFTAIVGTGQYLYDCSGGTTGNSVIVNNGTDRVRRYNSAGVYQASYSTISLAAAAAGKGDNIYVSAGTYDEQINCTVENVSFIGENKNTTIIKPSSGSGIIVNLNISGNSISNFTLDASANSSINQGIECVNSNPLANPVKIENNIIKGFLTSGSGIYAYGYNITLTDNTIQNYTTSGLYVTGRMKTVITNNTLSASGGFSGIGINSFEGDLTISNNTVSGNNSSGNGYGISIGVYSPGTGPFTLDCSENILQDNVTGISIAQFNNSYTANYSITHNNITSISGGSKGIYIMRASGAAGSTLNITSNLISVLAGGILFDNDSCNSFTAATRPTVTNNSIIVPATSANTGGVVSRYATVPSFGYFDISNNWWGNSTAPNLPRANSPASITDAVDNTAVITNTGSQSGLSMTGTGGNIFKFSPALSSAPSVP